jgi:hypothetical protein
MALVIRTVVVAVDPPNIGAVASANVDVAVLGVKPGDIVIATPPDTLTAGLAPQTATVPSADTVRLRITNASAGAIDGASLNWTLTIIKLGAPGGEGIGWAG